MRHRVKKIAVIKRTSQGKILQKNLAASLILQHKIVTTEKRAQLAKSLVEKVITLSKKPSLATRRQVSRLLKNNQATREVFSKLQPKYQAQAGGYTRTSKLYRRLGDGALLVQIELL